MKEEGWHNAGAVWACEMIYWMCVRWEPRKIPPIDVPRHTPRGAVEERKSKHVSLTPMVPESSLAGTLWNYNPTPPDPPACWIWTKPTMPRQCNPVVGEVQLSFLSSLPDIVFLSWRLRASRLPSMLFKAAVPSPGFPLGVDQ